MAGFTAIISNTERAIQPKLHLRKESGFGFESDYISQKIESDLFAIQQFTNSKFSGDKILEENTQYIIGTEGVIFNLTSLKKEYQTNDVFSTIILLFEKFGPDFIKQLRGDFSCFICHKPSKTWYVFSNPVNTKNIFYFCDKDYFIFSSELRNISHLLHQLGKSTNLNQKGAYLLLTYGFMLEDVTLIENVKRLMPGKALIFNDSKIKLEEYFHLKNISQTTDDKDSIIEKMDYLFSDAIHLEFEKDREYGYKHIATLSGGLDSRMTVLSAHKLGYTEQLNFTFSQSDYLDEKIAKKIASDYRHEFIFQSLDNGNYLKDIDKVVFYNDGLVYFAGGAHGMKFVENMNFSKYGLIHSGQIGDAVIGSFLSKPYPVKPTSSAGAYSTKLLDRISPFVDKVLKNYSTEELFKFYSRGFYGALNGNNYFDIFSQTASPFLNLDFLSYCYSIPYELKFKQKIYLKWIERKHIDFSKYPWEKTGISPLKSINFKRFFIPDYYLRMGLKVHNMLTGKMKTGMNPFDKWLISNKSLNVTLQTYFDNYIDIIHDSNLKKDCIQLYNEGSSSEKFQVLTLLAAIKLHLLN